MRVRLDERSFRMIRLEWKEERWVKVFVRDSGDFASLSWDDLPHPRSGFLNHVRRFSYRGGPLRAVIVCPGQHDRLQDQTVLRDQRSYPG